ncbi:DUF6210 family protein [Kitasatospora sp. NPDC088134]|uniref:DUF6210 family protein n=1 Tax=Kitasatospora sp. NPDC088134 TaxID=3364071 RepID=UPI0037F419DE
MADTDGDKRYVFLDPDSSGAGQGWVFAVVAADTGVVYQTQGGGYGCVQYQQEGYLVPLPARNPDDELRALFTGALKGQGARGLDWPPALLDRLRTAVAAHRYGAPGTPGVPLALDESRLPEADEAWLPVLTPDGPGVLVWENCD